MGLACEGAVFFHANRAVGHQPAADCEQLQQLVYVFVSTATRAS